LQHLRFTHAQESLNGILVLAEQAGHFRSSRPIWSSIFIERARTNILQPYSSALRASDKHLFRTYPYHTLRDTIVQQSMPLTAGTHIGPYEIVARIGEGGMGVVYLAHDSRLDRRVAIKLLPETLAKDSDMRERLRREAMAAAALDHPFICKVFEISEHGGTLFMVMEYIRGETLWTKLRAGRVPTEEAVRIASQIADALELAHRQGFVHRDLKPANIMLTEQGHVKVMDFGLAKRAEARGFDPWESWTGLTPDDALLLMRDKSTQEIYALKTNLAHTRLLQTTLESRQSITPPVESARGPAARHQLVP
jgi:serine/threonine protein kinase